MSKKVEKSFIAAMALTALTGAWESKNQAQAQSSVVVANSPWTRAYSCAALRIQRTGGNGIQDPNATYMAAVVDRGVPHLTPDPNDPQKTVLKYPVDPPREVDTGFGIRNGELATCLTDAYYNFLLEGQAVESKTPGKKIYRLNMPYQIESLAQDAVLQITASLDNAGKNYTHFVSWTGKFNEPENDCGVTESLIKYIRTSCDGDVNGQPRYSGLTSLSSKIEVLTGREKGHSIDRTFYPGRWFSQEQLRTQTRECYLCPNPTN